MSDRVLLIEDDDDLRASLAQTLELADIMVVQANGLAQARRAIRANFPGVVLSDIRMPGQDGFAVLERVRAADEDIPVIFLTGEADVPMAVRALQGGAYDFLEKPCGTEPLLKALRRALDHRKLVLQSRLLQQRLETSDIAAINFPGSSRASTQLRSELRRVAALPVNVYFSGDAGVGKRLAAHTLHVLSGAQEPAQMINFAEHALENDLNGRFVTLKNLDALTEEEAAKLEQELTGNAQARVLATGSENSAMFAKRLPGLSATVDAVEICVPSLFDRASDLPVIFENLMRQAARHLNIDIPQIPATTFEDIAKVSWEGNLPELRAFARATLLGLSAPRTPTKQSGLTEQVNAFEKTVLLETLRRNQGKASLAADELKLARKTFYDRLNRHGIRPKDIREDNAQDAAASD